MKGCEVKPTCTHMRQYAHKVLVICFLDKHGRSVADKQYIMKDPDDDPKAF